MADITLVGQLTISKGGAVFARQINMMAAISASVPGAAGGSPLIGTAAQELDLSQVTAPGVCYVRNSDATNFVTLGTLVDSNYVPFLKLLPGEAWPFRAAGATIAAKADTAAVRLDIYIADA